MKIKKIPKPSVEEMLLRLKKEKGWTLVPTSQYKAMKALIKNTMLLDD